MGIKYSFPQLHNSTILRFYSIHCIYRKDLFLRGDSIPVINPFIVFSLELFEWPELVIFDSILIPRVPPSLNLWCFSKKGDAKVRKFRSSDIEPISKTSVQMEFPNQTRKPDGQS